MAAKAPTTAAGKTPRTAKARAAASATEPAILTEPQIVAAEAKEAERSGHKAEAGQAASDVHLTQPIEAADKAAALAEGAQVQASKAAADPPPPHPDDASAAGDAPQAEAAFKALIPAPNIAPEEMLRLAAVQTACIGMTDAAQFLRRMCIVAEAAAAAILRRDLGPATGPEAGFDALEQHLKTSVEAYAAMNRAALSHARDALAREGG